MTLYLLDESRPIDRGLPCQAEAYHGPTKSLRACLQAPAVAAVGRGPSRTPLCQAHALQALITAEPTVRNAAGRELTRRQRRKLRERWEGSR